MIRAAEAPPAQPSQTGAYLGHLDDGTQLLVRLYSDDTTTAERKVRGVYMGEVALTPERAL